MIDWNRCIFTGYEIKVLNVTSDYIEYFVNVNSKNHRICLPLDSIYWKESEPFFNQNKDVLFGLLYNNNWFEEERILITIKELKELISSKSFPATPNEKIENLLIKLLSYQNEDGQLVNVNTGEYHDNLWKVLYFKSVNELNYYVETLHSNGMIKAKFEATQNGTLLLQNFKITFDGLNYFLKLVSEGENSNKCFVAMSFKSEAKEIRTAIKEAIIKTGFKPILIDELNIESSKTINDEIIANLKKCKFCIADFTYHSNGVYFESGFALGQGKKVIYTCQKDEFNSAHFDIKPLQHIIYETPEKLKENLIHKIEAWIK